MKEGMNEVEVALEMMKIIAQAELGTVTEKYFLGLYSECFSTIRAAQNAHGGAF